MRSWNSRENLGEALRESGLESKREGEKERIDGGEESGNIPEVSAE